MNDTKHDRHLHLVRVDEDKVVVRTVPARVKTERIHVSVVLSEDLGADFTRLGESPSRMPQVETLGEDIIVHEASVDGEKTHEKDDVATAGVNFSTKGLSQGATKQLTRRIDQRFHLDPAWRVCARRESCR